MYPHTIAHCQPRTALRYLISFAICLLVADAECLDAVGEPCATTFDEVEVSLLQTSKELSRQNNRNSPPGAGVQAFHRASAVEPPHSSSTTSPRSSAKIIVGIASFMLVIVCLFGALGYLESGQSIESAVKIQNFRTIAALVIFAFLSSMTECMVPPVLQALFLQDSCAAASIDLSRCHPCSSLPSSVVVFDDLAHCDPQYHMVQQRVAGLMATSASAMIIPQVFVCALLGCLGDAYGRRIPMFLPLVGGVLRGLLLASCSSLNSGVRIIVALLFLSGGGFVSTSAAFAALADVYPDDTAKHRSFLFGVMQTAILIAMFIGPALGSHLAYIIGAHYVCGVIAAISALNLLLTSLTFSEAVEGTRQSSFSLARSNPITSVLMFGQTRTTMFFVVVLLSSFSACRGSWQVLSLEATKVADFSMGDLEFLGSLGAGVSSLGLLLVLPILTRFMWLPHIMLLACANGVLHMLLMSTANSIWQFFAFNATPVCVPLFLVVIRCGMANTFGKKRFGESLAAVGLLEQVCTMIAPTLTNRVYDLSSAASFSVAGIAVRCPAALVLAGMYSIGCVAAMSVQDFPGELRVVSV